MLNLLIMPTAGLILVIDTKTKKIYIGRSRDMQRRIRQYKKSVRDRKDTLGKTIESVDDMEFERYETLCKTIESVNDKKLDRDEIAKRIDKELRFHKQTLLNYLDKKGISEMNINRAMNPKKYKTIKEEGSIREDADMIEWLKKKIKKHGVE